VEIFAHKNKLQNALLLSTLPVQLPSCNQCCVHSHHLRSWLLLLSGAEYMYQPNTCLPTQCRNPFSGNKIQNLTIWIALVCTSIWIASVCFCAYWWT
jgi:hypothetical protein